MDEILALLRKSMTATEWVAAIFGVICVVLTAKRNIHCWWTGIVSIVLFIWIFREAKLYADVLNQVVMLVLSVIGWVAWARHGAETGPLRVELASTRTRAVMLAVVAAGTPAMGFALRRWTDASLPFWDSFITVASFVAQWAITRKVVENWVIWIVVDLVAIGVYLAKHLYVTTGLYVVFLVLASFGLHAWIRALRNPEAAA
ncbi:MAG: nicotinamide riboside transporter PnuC [Planctomycetes bacterium]|nr:nicotinamide riboside transporter PnuC [Planctomycetota bacterium]